ncbi:DUF5753 domain-containing protein [Pilimelia anulata]|uniref:DUF5753 domain-containing protein n=1 Tax=Pilimelia anulata TaxID=53371 RepID=UPI001E47E206|nr:DUF5753 domain-containing protein [Pilimelia anulata]
MDKMYREYKGLVRRGMKGVYHAGTAARYERTSVFRVHEINVIPGMFQVEGYMRAVLKWWRTFHQAPNDDDATVAMRLPHISVGVIPLRGETSRYSNVGFWIRDDAMVTLETPTAGLRLTRPSEIPLYAGIFAALQNRSVYGTEARHLIATALADLQLGGPVSYGHLRMQADRHRAAQQRPGLDERLS